MKRKRLTQVFPFLLPIRKWQRKKLFYLEMLIDGNKYAKNKFEALLPNTVFETSSLMLNENSGFDMKYQINKVHNLKLAARTINKVIIEPNETFSFAISVALEKTKATKRLKEYMIKGFTIDDERLKGNGGENYWKELLDRIRDIRSSEKVLYRDDYIEIVVIYLICFSVRGSCCKICNN